MNTRINHEDMGYLHTFPGERKAAVMQRVMSHEPEHSAVLNGNTGYAKVMLKLHRDGFGLIDLQPQETAFATIWYRKSRAILRRAREEVAMLTWETQEQGELTTIMTWQV